MNVPKGGEAGGCLGALTAFPLVAVLLGGPIGLGCHFCYLILCMRSRLILRDCGVGGRGGQMGGDGRDKPRGMSPPPLVYQQLISGLVCLRGKGNKTGCACVCVKH